MKETQFNEYYSEANLLKRKGEHPKAIEVLDFLLSDKVELSKEQQASVKWLLSYLYLTIKKYKEAEILAEFVLKDSIENIRDGQKTRVADAYILLARVLYKSDSFQRSLDCVNKALPIFEAYQSKESSNLVSVKSFQEHLRKRVRENSSI